MNSFIEKAEPNKRNYFIILKYFLCIFIMLIGGLYYYYLLSLYYPSNEQIAAILTHYYHDKLTWNSVPLNNLFQIVSFLSYKIGGASVFSVRLFFATMQSFVFLFASILLICKYTSFDDLLISAPIFAFMALLLHPLGGVAGFGIVSPMIVNLFYNDHQAPVVIAMLSFVIFELYERCKDKKKKILILLLLFIVSLHGILKTDLCYSLIFLAPLIMILFIRLLRRKQYIPSIIAIASIFVSLIVLTRRLPSVAGSFFWSIDSVTSYSGPFYGSTSWMSSSELIDHMIKYMKNLLIFSNSDFSGYPLIDGYSFIFVIRVLLVILGLCLSVYVVYSSIKGITQEHAISLTDELIAWSIILQSMIYILTAFAGITDQFRYIWDIVILIPLLLCRTIPKFIKFINQRFDAKSYKTILLSIAFLFISLNISYVGAGTEKYSEDFEDELNNVCSFISEREAGNEYHEAIGIGPYWFLGRLVIETGEVFVNNSDNDETYNPKYNKSIRYIISNVDKSDHPAGMLRIGRVDDHDIRERFGDPIDVYEQEHINVYIYQ